MATHDDARNARRFYAAVAAGVAVVVVVTLATSKRSATGERPLDAPAGIEAWCAAGLEPVAGRGCFAAPKTRGDGPPTLLVYLHGRYAPEAAAAELERQERVARLATARGYAVLALHGRQGECTDPALATWWCWPSNEKNEHDGPAFVQAWAPALHAAEARIGKGRRVLLGFSNGGYFASLVASRELTRFDAVVIAHAGPVPPMRPVGTRPPVLLVNADEDPSDPEMQRLADDLTREKWPYVFVERGGGHALPEWDVTMALTFFDRVARELLPLVPPLAPAHVRTAPDAGSEHAADAGADEAEPTASPAPTE